MIAVKWLKNRFDEVMRIASPLATYTDVLDVPVEILSDEDRALNEQLLKRYLPPYMIGRELQMGMHKEMYVDCDGTRFEDFNSLFNYLEDIYIGKVLRDTVSCSPNIRRRSLIWIMMAIWCSIRISVSI